MDFMLKCEKRDVPAIKDMFRAHSKEFSSVYRSHSQNSEECFVFRPKSIFHMSTIQNILRNEKDMGTEFQVSMII